MASVVRAGFLDLGVEVVVAVEVDVEVRFTCTNWYRTDVSTHARFPGGSVLQCALFRSELECTCVVGVLEHVVLTV